jgi:two-component system response regulator YesN
MRICVIEDEERLLAGLVRVIESVGPRFKVVGTAENGESGIEVIKRTLPDVVFTDVRMPVMDGLEMIQRLMKSPAVNCSFVIISAFSDFEYTRQAIRYGVVDYILKPVTFEDIESVLHRLNRDNAYQRNAFAGGSIEETHPLPEGVNPLIRQAVDIIHQNFATQLTLDGIASRLDVSSEYFSQLFSRQMGITFTTYLKHYRIDAAKRLLLERRWKMRDVAAMTGYQTAQYFCRVFKEVTNISPSEFVRQYTQ